MLTDAMLAEIEARAKAATPEPWEVARDDNYGPPHYFECYGPAIKAAAAGGTFIATNHDCGEPGEDANAVFIAHARQDIPALIAALRESRRALKGIASYESRYGPSDEALIARGALKGLDMMLGRE